MMDLDRVRNWLANQMMGHTLSSEVITEFNKLVAEVEQLKQRLKDEYDETLKFTGSKAKEIERLKAENEKLKERLEDVYLKDTGKTREINILTKENNQLREALGPMRQLIMSLKENGSSHAFFIMQQAWGDLDWDEVVEMMDSLLETLKDST